MSGRGLYSFGNILFREAVGCACGGWPVLLVNDCSSHCYKREWYMGQLCGDYCIVSVVLNWVMFGLCNAGLVVGSPQVVGGIGCVMWACVYCRS